MERVKLNPSAKFTAQWKGPIEGHAVNQVKRWFPSLCAEHEFDDLMQEAFLVFMRCSHRYAGRVDNPAWFMSLFSRALSNRLINLAARCGRIFSLEDVDVHEPSVDAEGFGAAVLNELPETAKKLIYAVCFGPDADARVAFRRCRDELATRIN